MTATTTSANLFSFLTFDPTREQAEALYFLEEFLAPECGEDVFVLRGAAGTGKTSLVRAVVDFLEAQEIGCYLTAPTGRAAKVLGHKTRSVARTIHHTVYRVLPTDDERVMLERRPNAQSAYSVFVVDEASMLSDTHHAQGDFVTSASLLHDLLHFVKQGNARNKVVFIGDRYQLAPVGDTESVALNLGHFMKKYQLRGQQAELTEVKRQTGASPVLALAHDIRHRADEGRALGKLDLYRLYNATAAVTRYLNLYDANRPDQVVMIGCANQNVHTFNTMVRQRQGYGGTLAVGDQVVVDQNWVDSQHLIVRGETGIVRDLSAIEKRADLEFATVTLEFLDPDQQPLRITTKVLLDTLRTPTAELPTDAIRNLKADRMAKNADYRKNPHPANDPYMGAMQLRYGHGLTAHKAQGGEWNHVLLHPWFYENDYRYAYTAVTRARENVTSWEQGGWWQN